MEEFGIALKIKTEADLKALNLSEEATKRVAKEFQQSNAQIGQAAQKMAQQTQQAAQTAANATDQHQKATTNLHRAVIPLIGGVTALTSAIQAQNPALGAAINVVDNFAISAVGAGAATGGWTGVLKALGAFLNPWVALVTVAGAAVAFFATQSSKAREDSEKLDTAMRSGGFDFLKDKVQAANTKLAETEKKLETILALQAKVNAPPGSPLARAQDAGLAGQRKDLAEASRAAEQAQRDLDTTRRNKAAESLPDVQRALDLQLKLSQARERDKPLIEAEAAASELRSKGLLDEDIGQQRATLSGIALAKQREIDRNAAFTQGEALRSLAKDQLQQKLQLEEIAIAQGSAVASTREYAVQLALLEKESQRAAAIHDRQLSPALATAIEKTTQLKIAVIDAAEAAKKQAAENQRILDSFTALEAIEERKRQGQQEDLDYLAKKNALEQRAGDFRIQALQAAGAPENIILQQQIQLLQQRREALQQPGAPRTAGDLEGLDQSIVLAQIRLLKLQDSAIDVAGEVSRVVTDITSAVVNGTLKWSDISRSILASFVRVALEQFTGFLRNMQDASRFAQFAGGAIANTATGGALPGSQGGGGFGNILSLGSNLLGGGGGGGFLSGLSNLFQGGGFASSFGFGSAPTGVSGPLMANGGFFSGGSLLGGLLNFLPGIGGLLGGLLGGRNGNIGLGIAGSLAGTVAGSSASLLAGGTGGILTSLLPSLTPLLSNPWTAIIAAVVALFASIFGAQKPDPTAILKAQFSGIFYDELEKQFKPGTVSVGVLRTADIKGSTVERIRGTVQAALAEQAERWTEILNIFPRTVSDDMIPTLDAANTKLNDIFSRLKFTEGGSRNIQEELRDFQGREGARGFFSALRPTLGVGFEQSLLLAGLPRSAAAAKLGIGQTIGFEDTLEGAPKFVEAIAKTAAIVGSLSKISARGAAPFLTAADTEFTERRLSKLFNLSGQDFTEGVDKIEEQLSPVIDFLKQSVSQASDLFGRGLIAALDAATTSQANQAFMQSLGAGTKDVIFQGITQAFIASAQFTDLLAPIQQTIREFTQEAIATGQAPDVDAFRRALLPDIESISTRAETLRPLIEALQELGLNINDSIKKLFGLGGAAGVGLGDIHITINGDVDSDERANDFARRIEKVLRAGTPPPI